MSNTTQQLKAQQRRQQFSDLLRAMFQLNQPELDFGLYRIMHARKDDINRFIEKDLPRITQDAFANFANADKTQIEQELEKAISGAKALEVDPDSLPKVQELQAKLADNFDLAREEGEVYDALVTFFNRYYSEGDFLSRRVYKDGTYAIPYQGEEVVLHWANKDQYYIKSSETLRDYSFRLNPNAPADENPQRVHFKLVDAEAGAKDNNKEGNDNKRVFILDSDTPYELIDGDSNENGESFPELQLRFYFRAASNVDWTEAAQKSATAAAQKKPPTQDHLRAIAVESLLGAESALPEEWKALLAQPYKKADGDLADYSMLQGQMNNYTKKNSFDYFIHKDLSGFLTRELDFYIKNELLDWSDIATLKNDTARLAPLLSKIEVIRTLGEKIIAFLAQLENFQKKLWLKKKFVTETNYCITLDRLQAHPELLRQVFDNPKQRSDWQELYKLDMDQLAKDLEAESIDSLLEQAKYRYLMLDTEHFDHAFKALLVATMEDLDEQCDGLLVHSDNFHALNLLQEKYKGKVKGVYIDPPYNTDSSEIIYKNGYKKSSWASLINNAVPYGKQLMKENGVICATIDDEQQKELSLILRNEFGQENELGTVAIKINPSGRITLRGFAQAHEYAIFYGRSQSSSISKLPRSDNQFSRFNKQDEKGVYEQRNFRREGSSSSRSERPKRYFPIYVNGDSIRIPQMKWNEGDRAYEIIEEPNAFESVIYPIDDNDNERVWRWGIERILNEITEVYPKLNPKGVLQLYYKYRPNAEGVLPLSIWSDKKYSATEYGTATLKKMFGGRNEFDFPKSIHAVEDCLRILANKKESNIFLDYFAGSGTTGHAAINLTRLERLKNKYVLAEMGGHFDTVIRPRLKKVVYSELWKSGTPIASGSESFNGISQAFKYIRLESYEDALGNLPFDRAKRQSQLLDVPEKSSLNEARQSFLLRYILDVELREAQSLLNTQQFLEPTNYKLNVRSASGDETKSVNVDLLETFNYLLGLTVEHIAAPIHFDAELSQGEFGRWQAKVKRNAEGKWWFRTVFGTNRNNQKVLVVWRNLPSVIAGEEHGLLYDNAVLDAVLIEKLAIRLTESLDDEIDILYVNGDHNIGIPRDRKGQPMEQARLQMIEEAFHRLMFAESDLV